MQKFWRQTYIKNHLYVRNGICGAILHKSHMYIPIWETFCCGFFTYKKITCSVICFQFTNNEKKITQCWVKIEKKVQLREASGIFSWTKFQEMFILAVIIRTSLFSFLAFCGAWISAPIIMAKFSQTLISKKLNRLVFRSGLAKMQ